MEFDVLVEIPKGQRNKYEVDHHSGRIRLDRNRQAIVPAYLARVEVDRNGKPAMTTLRVVPDVEQTFGGYFNATTPPPTTTTPMCRRTKPPPWAR